MENPVSNVVDSLPVEMRDLFVDVIGTQDGGLLSSFRAHAEPTQFERIAVEKILSDEFSSHLRHDYEPTERGRAIDNLLGAFLLRWPIATG